MGVCCCLQTSHFVKTWRLLENEIFFELKNDGYRDDIKRKETS